MFKVYLKSEYIEYTLARRNHSREWLAIKISTSPQYLSAMMNGKKSPSPDMRKRIVMALSPCKWEDVFRLVEAVENE